MCNKTVGNQHASGFHLKIYSEFAVLALLIKDNLKVYANLKSLYHKVNSQLAQMVTVQASQLHEFSLGSLTLFLIRLEPLSCQKPCGTTDNTVTVPEKSSG